MTAKKNNSPEWDKCFSFEKAFRIIGLNLDRKLVGTKNQVRRDLAGMDAIFDVLNLLTENVISSFSPVVGMEEM